MPKLAKNGGRGMNFGGQLELHRCMSSADTSDRCSSKVVLPLRASRVNLRQRDDGENHEGRHDLITTGNEKEKDEHVGQGERVGWLPLISKNALQISGGKGPHGTPLVR